VAFEPISNNPAQSRIEAVFHKWLSPGDPIEDHLVDQVMTGLVEAVRYELVADGSAAASF